MKDVCVYIYPAIFTYIDEDNDVLVDFPNLDSASTCGSTTKEAYSMAKNSLASSLCGMEAKGEDIPLPPKKSDIKLKKNQDIQMIKINIEPIHDTQDEIEKKILS